MERKFSQLVARSAKPKSVRSGMENCSATLVSAGRSVSSLVSVSGSSSEGPNSCRSCIMKSSSSVVGID